MILSRLVAFVSGSVSFMSTSVSFLGCFFLSLFRPDVGCADGETSEGDVSCVAGFLFRLEEPLEEDFELDFLDWSSVCLVDDLVLVNCSPPAAFSWPCPLLDIAS